MQEIVDRINQLGEMKFKSGIHRGESIKDVYNNDPEYVNRWKSWSIGDLSDPDVLKSFNWSEPWIYYIMLMKSTNIKQIYRNFIARFVSRLLIKSNLQAYTNRKSKLMEEIKKKVPKRIKRIRAHYVKNREEMDKEY